MTIATTPAAAPPREQLPVNGAREEIFGRRIAWLDSAKGLGILLVVFGHALGGIIDSPAGRGEVALRALFAGIYVFHMPLFFLLAGLLVQRRLAKSRVGFGIDLLVTVAWPYFLWSAIQLSMIVLVGESVNTPIQSVWRPIFRLPVATTGQFYFLYILFFMHLASILAVRRIGPLPMLVLACIAKALNPYLPMTQAFHLLFHNFPYYALGVWLGTERIQSMLGRASPRFRIAIVSAAVVAIFASAGYIVADGDAALATMKSGQLSKLAWHSAFLPAALLAVLAIILLADGLPARTAAVLSYLGRRSMAIFVVHILFMSGVRMLLVRIHVNDPEVLLGICVLVGLIAPLAVFEAAKRFNAVRLLGLG